LITVSILTVISFYLKLKHKKETI